MRVLCRFWTQRREDSRIFEFCTAIVEGPKER